MEVSFKESSFKNKKNLLSSIYSITEKQEESNNSSIRESNIIKHLVTDNSNNFLNKNGINDNKSLESIKSKIYFSKKISSKTFNKIIGDNNNNNNNSSFNNKNKEEKSKKLLKSESYKKYKDNNNYSYEQNKFRNSTSNRSNNFNSPFQILKQINKKRKKSQNITGFNNIFNNKLFKIFYKKSFSNKSLMRKKSFNLSSSGSSMIKFNNNKNSKIESFLSSHKRIIKIDFKNDKILSINLFEKLKESPMFEKSVKILKKQKFLYSLLAFFTVMSILFQSLDAFLYKFHS